MQVTVEETGVIERKLTVSVPFEQFSGQIETKLRELVRTVKLPGFRPGKVPMNVVRKKYSWQVNQQVMTEVTQNSLQEALTQENLPSGGVVDLTLDPAFAPGHDLQYTATIDIVPDIPVLSLRGIRIDKPECAINDEDVDQTIEKLRASERLFLDKEGVAEIGDQVVIDYNWRIDNGPSDDDQVKDLSLILGDGYLMAPIEEGIAGAAVGETRTITCTMPEDTLPEDHGYKEHAGKEVVFEVTIKKVQRVELPEVNDTFAEQFGVQAGGVTKLREEVRASMEQEYTHRRSARIHNQVMDILCEANRQVELPRPMVEREIDRLCAGEMRWRNSLNLSKKEIDRDAHADHAHKSVLLSLITHQIVIQNKLGVTDDQLRSRVEEIAQAYDDPSAAIRAHYADPEKLQELKAMLLQDQITDTLLETADVQEVNVSFQEFMNR